MIISHRHRYIYVKAEKVGGTSVEVALARSCGPEDIITPSEAFDPSKDETPYSQPGQNASGFRHHSEPSEIRRKIGENIWREYFKIGVVRNPWDLVVSQYFWEKSWRPELQERILRNYLGHMHWLSLDYHRRFVTAGLRRILGVGEDFGWYARAMARQRSVEKYWFDTSGRRILDRYLSFENLNSDFGELCEELGIDVGPLPRLKTLVRRSRRAYPDFYTAETRRHIETIYGRTIAAFGYQFGGKREAPA
jgi:hypothetical protein